MNDLVLISGGGTGIGFEVAQKCLEKSWTPVLIGRRKNVLEKASRQLQNCPFLPVDLSEDSAKRAVEDFLKNFTTVNVLGVVNNAGIYAPMSLETSDQKNWISQYQVNVLGALNLTQSCIPHLKKSKGSIVNISSTLGERPIPGAAAYSASKAAMNSLTLSLALELAPDGIRANAVCPGIVNTPIHDPSREDVDAWKSDLKSMQPMGRVGEPEDIAPTVIMLLDPVSSWTTGALINIDGGILLKS